MSILEAWRELLDLRSAYKLLNNNIDCPELLYKFNFRLLRSPNHKPITPLPLPHRRIVFAANSPSRRLLDTVNNNKIINTII